MKPTVDEKLSAVLGMELTTSDVIEIDSHKPAEIESSGNPDKDMQDDFGVVRSTIHNLIEKGNELVDNANFFAKEKQDARSVEAASMAQKEARETAMALINLHKTRKDIERVSATSIGGDTNIAHQNNAVFIGTTGELLKMTKELNADGMLKKALTAIEAPQEDIIDVEIVETEK